MPTKFRIAEAAEHLGVSTKTLRRWESSGKLLSKRSKGGHRYYTQAILDSFTISNSKVSSEPRPAAPEFFPAGAIPSLFTPASKISAFRIVLLSLFGSLMFSGIVLGASSVLTYGSLKLPIKPYLSTINSTQKPQVLAEETTLDSYSFNVNIPANFAETAVFAKDITAPNIITGIEAENLDVTISGGIATLENTAQTFKTIKVGSTTFDAGSINDILELAAGGSSSISIDTTNKKVTISSSSPDYTLSGWTIGTGSVYSSTITNNIGIGTTSPTSRLHVVGTSNLAGDVILGTAASDDITVLGAISAGSSIIPSVDLGADLGSALKRFNNIWAANINSNSSQSFAGQTFFTYEPTDTTIAQASVLINPTAPAANGQLLAFGVAGFQKALIDEDGDMVLGYNNLTSAPATDNPLMIYGHSGTNVANVTTSGGAYFAGSVGAGVVNPGYTLEANGYIAASSGYVFVPSGSYTGNRISWNGTYGGMDFYTSGDLKATIGNSANNYISGSLGIGTPSPGARLDVTSTDSIAIRGESTKNNGAAYGLVGYSRTANIGNNIGVYGYAFNSGGGAYSFYSDGGNLYNSGKVGIGTDSPISKLHVSGAVTGKALAIFDETGNQALFTASAGGVMKVVIDHNGNMGLNTAPYGTTSPLLTKLQVTGATSTTDGITILESGGGYGGQFIATNSYGNNGGLIIKGTASNGGLGGSGITILSDTNKSINIAPGRNSITQLLPTQVHTTYIVGSDASTDILRWTNSTTPTPSILGVIDSAGNVGIGTADPSYALQVASGQASFASGTSSAPSITFGSLDRGFYLSAGNRVTAVPETGKTLFQLIDSTDAGLMLSSIYPLSWGTMDGSSDLALSRDAAGILALRRYTATQEFRIYNTDDTADEFASLGFKNNSNVFTIETEQSGGGTVRNIALMGGNVGIGTASPISKLHVSGAVTGKALGIFDETGDQALFTASASSVPKFTILHNGLVDARIGVATYSKAGTISDTDFTDTAVDGLIGIDTTNHRIYFREGGAWSFAAKDGGFQIPNYEAGGLSVGDYLVPYVESTMEDGAVHGLYAKFSDVKADLFAEVLGTENEKYLGIASQSAETKKSQDSLSSRFEEFLSALKETVTAVTGYFKEIFADKTHQKELCVGEEGNETCITKDRLDELLKTLPSPTPTPAPVESSVPTPTPEAVIEASPTATPMPTATDSGQVQ